jgi:hypothetical protein
MTAIADGDGLLRRGGVTVRIASRRSLPSLRNAGRQYPNAQ